LKRANMRFGKERVDKKFGRGFSASERG
jgi:hypothetical protein